MNSIYGNYLPELEQTMHYLVEEIHKARNQIKSVGNIDPVEHLTYRIKSEESMREKCRRKNLPETATSALSHIHDAIGIRVVCAFISDVYSIRDYLVRLTSCEVISEKDYIKHAKENGYRSFHLILKVNHQFFAEIQLRTISQDTWAALEHHIHYKKRLSEKDALIISELKRCADELASTDLSMQTIRDLMNSTGAFQEKQ